MADTKLYTKDSIESLTPLQFTRQKPGVYAGDTSYSTQLLIEIVSNSIDEFHLGHGNHIDVEINGSTVKVRDYGQGFLINEKRESDGKTVLEAAFSVLNTSGKYREDGAYEGTSLGSFGIGSKITTFLSHWLIVTTVRDGQSEKIWFKEGEFEKRQVVTNDRGATGTTVEWLPSEEFFTNTEVEIDKIRTLFDNIVCLCPGLTINLTYNGKKESYYSANGLRDFVDKAIGNKEIINNRFFMQFEEGKEKMDFILTYTSQYSSTLIPYVNTGLTEKGPHISQIKTVLTREFNKFFREKNWLKEKDENLTGDDIQEGMYIIFNITAPNVAYNAQVKNTITQINMTAFTQALAEHLQYWFASNEKEIKIIADKTIAARKAREAAKQARDNVREGKKKKAKALKFDSKLADCYSRDRSRCEIYITEGDSASGNLKQARNNEFQAVIPIRGKIINTEKAPLDKIQKNAEIMTMIEAFGLTIDTKTMKLSYNPEDLRYGKIIIAADADVDGNHIRNLFYTFIWNFCPQLILDGYVYSLVAPLYKITMGKDTYIYLRDDAELRDFQEKNKGKKFQVSRFKGLGEMSAEETEVLVDADKRILCQVTVEDAKAAEVLFDQLMGSAVGPRKKFIQEHSEEAGQYGI